MSILVSEKPVYLNNNSVIIGNPVEIIKNNEHVKQSEHSEYKKVDKIYESEFIQVTLKSVNDSQYTVVMEDKTTMNFNRGDYYFRVQNRPRQGGKKKTRTRKIPRKTKRNKKSRCVSLINRLNNIRFFR